VWNEKYAQIELLLPSEDSGEQRIPYRLSTAGKKAPDYRQESKNLA
jgi:hypothetical protein